MARLIDTSVFDALERERKPLNALKAALSGEPFAISSISAAELLVGVHLSRSGDERFRRLRFVESVLNSVAVLAYDLDTARTHARLLADLSASGRSIGKYDLLIAATALTHGYEVLTLNLREFERVPGLVVQAPDW